MAQLHLSGANAAGAEWQQAMRFMLRNQDTRFGTLGESGYSTLSSGPFQNHTR
jgi:hypothetical protein